MFTAILLNLKSHSKKQNADFLENKTNSERAEQLFGADWENIISNATLALQDEFLSRILIYKEKLGRTDKGAITLGWKFELLNVESGQLSGNMRLSREQMIDVYAGTNLKGDKRDAFVNGKQIPFSGVANYILLRILWFKTPRKPLILLFQLKTMFLYIQTFILHAKHSTTEHSTKNMMETDLSQYMLTGLQIMENLITKFDLIPL